MVTRPVTRTAFRDICDAVAGQGLRLGKAIPRGHDHLLLNLRGADGSILAGQWFADPARAGSVAASTRARCPNAGVRLIRDSGVVLHPGGADRRLPTVARLVATPGSRLVAHRPERRAVVRELRPDGRVAFTKAVRPDRLARLLPLGRALEIPGVALPRVIDVDRAGATVSTEALPGRLLHDLLGDPRVPGAELTRAAHAVGLAVATLHSTVPPPSTGGHDAAAELSLTWQWWERAAAFGLLDLAGPAARAGFPAARRLLGGASAAPSYLHRDLHDRQLLVSRTARVGMLDFDLAAVGEAALDLANLLVHLDLRALQGHCSWDRAAECGNAILAGYRPSPSVARRLPGYALTTRLRLAAVYAFRPGGAEAAHDLLARGGDAALRGTQRCSP